MRRDVGIGGHSVTGGRDGESSRLDYFASLAVRDEAVGAKWFYPEAHRFCSWLAGISGHSVSEVAGAVAALSPRNSWEANQLDAIALCLGACDEERPGFGAMPRDRAIARRILNGEPPEEAMKGPKTRAFYRNLAHPRADVGVPVDRHLARALWGRGTSEADLSRRLSRKGEYERAEEAFSWAAKRAGLRPIELANRVWFVVRRLNRQNGQHSHCLAPVRWLPTYPGGNPKIYKGHGPALDLLPGCLDRPWLYERFQGPRFAHETRERDRGRIRVNLYKGHRFANSAGWQWRHRLVVAYALGVLPRPDEHVHHENETIDDDRLENLSVVCAEYHGRIHARGAEVAGRRGDDGKFRSYKSAVDVLEFSLNRSGPVLSARSIDKGTQRPVSRLLGG